MLKSAITWRAINTPSLVTPVFIRTVAGCLHTVTNSSSRFSTIFTGRFDFRARKETIGSNLSDPFDPNPPPKVSTTTLPSPAAG